VTGVQTCALPICALERAAWVKKNAADLLGISRRAIHYKIKKYNIQIPGKDQDE
jgi:transcriptional regulator with GAF, ATPase, and Fis domain